MNVCGSVRELQFSLGAVLTNVALKLALAYCKCIELAPHISLTLHAKTLAVIRNEVTSLHKRAITESRILSNIFKFEM